MSVEGVFIYFAYLFGILGFAMMWSTIHFLQKDVDRLRERLNEHEYWNDDKEKNHVRPQTIDHLEARIKRLEDRK